MIFARAMINSLCIPYSVYFRMVTYLLNSFVDTLGALGLCSAAQTKPQGFRNYCREQVPRKDRPSSLYSNGGLPKMVLGQRAVFHMVLNIQA